MNETRFLISEAAKTVDVETHVLRYWEEELGLPIARNEMGHRCYTRQDIQIFLSIKELKKKGFQLKTIKELIPVMRREVYSRTGSSDKKSPEPKPEAVEKKEEFFRILDELLTKIKETNQQEERYKRLDAAIRRHQVSRKMVAATKEQGKKRRKKYSGKEKKI
ncbi:MAG: helix-turn-helix domain-containing protein [Ruminococcus sp.]